VVVAELEKPAVRAEGMGQKIHPVLEVACSPVAEEVAHHHTAWPRY